MDIRNPVLAILVGGAPAPGINGVIAAVTIEALNSGCSVLGIYEGFKQLKQGKSMVTNLEWEDVTRIYNKGGSILRTSKQQLTTSSEIDNCLRVLEHHRVRYLVTIGGVQTAYSASLVATAAKAAKLTLSVAHVPKTIFNDLPLPPDCRTFGYSTAREVGMQMVYSFSNDARTMLRWYILVVMGQRAGHLALGIGKAGAATLTLIPEQYKHKVTFNDLASTMEAAIYKRKAMNKEYGVAVISEGLVHCLEQKEMLERFGDADSAHSELGNHLCAELKKRFKTRKIEMTVVARNIGNEIRSADPQSSDIVLTRDLGYAATRFLMEGGTNAMVTLKGGSLYSIPFAEFVDAASASAQIRPVDVTKLSFEVAQSYMILLRQSDLGDVVLLNKMARAANMTPQEFLKTFGNVALTVNSTNWKREKSTGEAMSVAQGAAAANTVTIPAGAAAQAAFTATAASVAAAANAANTAAASLASLSSSS